MATVRDSGRLTRSVGFTGIGLFAAIAARAGYELYRFRVDIENNVDYDETIPVDGLYGDFTGEPIRLGVMGDSLMCGKGATAPARTAAALMANWLAEREQRPVALTNVARSGAGSRHLHLQLQDLMARLGPDDHCDVVLVNIGAIDVSNSVTWGVARADIRIFIHDLTRTGAKVLFAMPERASLATCFAGRPLLSAFCDAMMQRRARKQKRFLDEFRMSGFDVRAVDTAPLTWSFTRNPHYTSDDLLHPSDAGQAAIASVIAPQLSAALHDRRDSDRTRRPHQPTGTRGVRAIGADRQQTAASPHVVDDHVLSRP